MKKFSFTKPKIKIERYPNIDSVYRNQGDDDDGHKDFFSFEDGVEVDTETTQGWVNECLRHLVDNPEENYYYCQGGDTLVMAVKNEDEINVWVSKSHIKATIPLYENPL